MLSALNFQKLRLRRPPQLFRSAITGAVWPRSVLGCAPGENTGKVPLVQVSHGDLDSDPALSRERVDFVNFLAAIPRCGGGAFGSAGFPRERQIAGVIQGWRKEHPKCDHHT